MNWIPSAQRRCGFTYNINICIIFPSLNFAKLFESIPDEPRSKSGLEFWQITCAVINASNEVKVRYCGNFEFITFLGERVFVGNIVNIRNSFSMNPEKGNHSLKSYGLREL